MDDVNFQFPPLDRPLAFFDLETTGTDRTKARITEYCFHVFYPNGESHVFHSLVNPEQPIPPAVTALTGISDETVKNEQTFLAHVLTISNIVTTADLVGFGCLQYDVPVLFSELHRCGFVWDYSKCRIVDVGNIFKRQVPRDLSSALLHYAGRAHTGAHGARADVDATREVFLRQIERHALTPDLGELARYANYDRPLVDLSGKFVVSDEGEVLFNFSAKKGERAKEHPSLLEWMLDKDFSEDVKLVCRRLLAECYTTDENNSLTDQLPF